MANKKNLDQKQLSTEIAHLTQQVRLHNSFVRRFLMGIVAGVGTAVGATIVASVLVYSLSRIIKTVDDIPILGNIIQSERINQIIQQE